MLGWAPTCSPSAPAFLSAGITRQPPQSVARISCSPSAVSESMSFRGRGWKGFPGCRRQTAGPRLICLLSAQACSLACPLHLVALQPELSPPKHLRIAACPAGSVTAPCLLPALQDALVSPTHAASGPLLCPPWLTLSSHCGLILPVCWLCWAVSSSPVPSLLSPSYVLCVLISLSLLSNSLLS